MSAKRVEDFEEDTEEINETEIAAVLPPEMPEREKPETKSRRRELLMFPSVYAGIERAAKARGRSVNDLINEILKEWLRHGSC